VAIRVTGLCGSDLHYFNHYRNGDILVKEPLTLGHESSGVVVAVGSQVTSLAVGDNVALEVGQPCEACELCLEGRYNICKEMKFRSSAKAFPHAQGTLQDRVNHPARWCHRYADPSSFFFSFLRFSFPFFFVLKFTTLRPSHTHRSRLTYSINS
jgi:L-iditol 2-dehydrogenase